MSRAKKLHWRAMGAVACAVVLLAVGLAACADDDGGAGTANAALTEANAASSEAATALTDAQAAAAAAEAALRAAEAAQAAADLAQATAEGNQEAVAAAEAALADAQDAAAAARDEAAAAQAEADSAREAAEAAQAEAAAQAAAAAEAAEEPPPPPPEDAGPVTISFLGFYGPEGVAPLLDAFHAENPGITVEYQSVPFGELNQVIQSRLANGGESPDVYIADQPRVAALDNQGFLHDVTDAVGDAANDWVDTALTASTVDGRLMALPLNTSTQILYYNKTLLDQRGFPTRPRRPTTA